MKLKVWERLSKYQKIGSQKKQKLKLLSHPSRLDTTSDPIIGTLKYYLQNLIPEPSPWTLTLMTHEP